ncbi:MAG: hypothetical protein UR42_C0005G0013 [Candidatus Roizmanbacteria bacterium GW2011_GWA2_33_33]|uniref:DUF4258 domain-containing protein n=2 Tax=Candidatus Roizmaniibacteriota TaxID=1752723 RepID=A0A0G0E6N2_9BACT|nr:MAG: hypothetical protein UR42_C0005G0013 [Candidatus Roizmanbacteria bacterium GW2011_GWA2_33_33]KKP63037.1 MAG: hypothetical protein UR56_C0002G0014 [Candidatus Roizmanbacteria bacterium GW2011_GWC2_34_23]
MKYVFTKHAKERMRLRKVSKDKVVDTIKNYESKALDDETENKIAFYKIWEKEQVLKVVTAQDRDKIRIITVHPISIKRLKNIKNLIEIK